MCTYHLLNLLKNKYNYLLNSMIIYNINKSYVWTINLDYTGALKKVFKQNLYH